MKTLDEIIKRDDYKKMTSQLRERTEELAYKIRNKMVQLDLKSVYKPAKGVVLHVVSGRSNVGSYHYLAVVEDEHGYAHYCIDGAYSGYVHGDFNCRVITASNAQCLKFLNAAKEIVEWLDRVESEKTSEIESALENTKNL